MIPLTSSELMEIAAICLGGVLLLRISAIIFRYLKTYRHEPSLWGHIQMEILKGVVQFFIVAFVFYYVLTVKHHEVIAKLLEVLLIFVGGYLSARVVALAMDLLRGTMTGESKLASKELALPVVGKLISVFIYVIALLVALHFLGYNVTALLAGMGIAGIAVSLAAKDSVSSIIAGILLAVSKPFVPGDRIEIWNPPPNQSTWGDVVEVGLRSTKVRTTDSITIIIPNSQLMNRDIINYTEGSPIMRLRVPVSVSYRSDVESVEKVLIALAGEIKGVLKDPAPRVLVDQFGESSITMELRVWIGNAKRRTTITDQINRRIKVEFEKSSIEIPYPKRDIYIKEKVTADREPGE
jgi:MscS family membrane protein